MANTPVSFYQFLNEQIIEIPILQRDYAQGRKGKEALRKTFLASLKKALDDALASDSGYLPLQLDFVYGSTIPHQEIDPNITLQPLDGQQRLTTLWLLHWYIALRAGKLEEASKILSRFSYETRISSRVFCQKMCAAENFAPYLDEILHYECSLKEADANTGVINNNNLEDSVDITREIKWPSVADFIKSKTWFYTKWKQDPTIQSMLRMLSGDKEDSEVSKKKRRSKKDLQVEINDDAIEKVFSSTPQSDFIKYWDLLKSNQSPIVFYHLPLKKFGLSDDLYVKMNARGKSLTPFENFKANLIGYIRRQRDKEIGNEQYNPTAKHNPMDSSWEKVNDPRTGVAILLDTTWANLFWKYRSTNDQIDEAFLTFLNRFFWNELFLTGIALEKNDSYIHLNKDNGAEFDDFTPYLYEDGEIPVSFFEDLTTVLNRYGKFNEAIKVPNQASFNYRPIYVDREKDTRKGQVIEHITQPGRILFFAITKYFKEGEYNEVTLHRWVRVVSNLISGVDEDNTPQIRSVEQVRMVIDKLNPLDSHKIYEELAKHKLDQDPKRPFDLRFNEEIEKARQILNDDRAGLREYPYENKFTTWEEAIIHYETFSFFKGSIRFLFHNVDGSVDWTDFDTKSKNAEVFFSKENGYYKTTSLEQNEKNNNQYLLKILYSRTTSQGFWAALWWKYHVYSNNDCSWLHLLNHPKMVEAVHHLLIGDELCRLEKPVGDDFAKHTLYLLSQTRLLDYVAKNIPNPWVRDYHNHKAIYPSSTGIFLNAEFRDDFLQNTENITLASNCKVEDTGLLFGSNIDFLYKNKYHFRWYNSDSIYMTSGYESDRIIRNANGSNDSEKYFMFKAKEIKLKDQIIDNLERVISEYKAVQAAK